MVFVDFRDMMVNCYSTEYSILLGCDSVLLSE